MRGKIDWQRVVQGGLLAGVTANALQFGANRLFLANEWRSALLSIGHPSAGSSSNVFSLSFAASRFPLFSLNLVGGVFVVWLYAMIRPRFGIGSRTAAQAGLVFWLFSSLLPVSMWRLSGGLPAVPAGLLAIHLTTYLVIAVLQTMAGAWTYRDQAA